MIRGLYSAASGMLAQQTRHDVVANNLANISTPGYRRLTTSTRAFEVPYADTIDPRPAANFLYTISTTDTAAGSVHETGNRTDFAVRGNGYFTLQTPEGPAYTRNGAFHLDPQGQLVSDEGYPVLGTRGPVTITGKQWEVAPDRRVIVNGKTVDSLQLADIPDLQNAVRMGKDLWLAKNAVLSETATVAQQYLEGANTNAVSEMVALINVTRQYEANQKCLQAQDETLGRAVNEIARI